MAGKITGVEGRPPAGIQKPAGIPSSLRATAAQGISPTHQASAVVRASVIPRLPIRTVAGVDFAPVSLSHLMHLRESMEPALTSFGLSLSDVQEHVFRPALRPAGPIGDIHGAIAPKLMAQNAVAAFTVAVNGAETGTAENYKKVKTTTDGIGAAITHKGLTIAGNVLAEHGFHFVVVATEGTESHPKPGEPAIGNPTIPQGTMYPGHLPLQKEAVGPSGKIFVYREMDGIFILLDVIEGTEIAATSLEAYQQISGRMGQPKDNGAVCLLAAYDQPAVIADTYVNKVIVSPEIAALLARDGTILWPEGSIGATLTKIAEATGRPVSDLGIMSLGTKPRKGSFDRPGRAALFDALARLGVKKLLTFDDGESPAVMLMARGDSVTFENGQRGPVDVFLGPGGAVEGVTAARTVADAAATSAQSSVAWWGYVSKSATKKPDTYFTMHAIPPAEVEKNYAPLGIDPRGSHNISDTLPDDGDRIFMLSSITANPRLNPYAIAPEIDESAEEDWGGTITVYQETAGSDGSVVGRYLTFKARTDIKAVKQIVFPVLPSLMRARSVEELSAGLRGAHASAAGLEAIRIGLRTYLYSLIDDAYNDGRKFYIKMQPLLLRRLANTLDDQITIALIKSLADEHPAWFVNPGAVAAAEEIISTNTFTAHCDAEGIPAKIDSPLLSNGQK